MAMFLLGINILIVMGVWHFVVKRTLLDHTRDKLFDLRDELRRTHLEQGWPIDSDLYGNLRSMINAYLRYTEHFSVWQVVALRVELTRQSKNAVRRHLMAGINAKFKAPTEQQQAYVASVRRRAGDALTDFAVYNSGLLLATSVLLTPIFFVGAVVDVCKKGASALADAVAHDVLHLGQALGAVWVESTRYVASWLVDQQAIDVAVGKGAHRYA